MTHISFAINANIRTCRIKIITPSSMAFNTRVLKTLFTRAPVVPSKHAILIFNRVSFAVCGL